MRNYITIFLFALAGSLIAQSENEDIKIDIPEVVLLSLQPDNSSITFYLDFGTEAGLLNLETYTDNSKYLNYSVCLASSSPTQAVYVKISSGKLPKGVEFRLEASTYTGTGDGQMGNSMGEIILNANDQKILTGIGGSYTGVGAGQGHQLTYSYEVVSPTQVDKVDPNPLTITYTLSND